MSALKSWNMTYSFIKALAFQEHDLDLRASLPNPSGDQISTFNCAICRVEDCHGTTTLNQMINGFIQSIQRNLLSQLTRSNILGIKEVGRLVVGRRVSPIMCI